MHPGGEPQPHEVALIHDHLCLRADRAGLDVTTRIRGEPPPQPPAAYTEPCGEPREPRLRTVAGGRVAPRDRGDLELVPSAHARAPLDHRREQRPGADAPGDHAIGIDLERPRAR